tara:strand:+ start:220 stop:411 length:192 start_codon:yes stop_codon:yes gene_type:complete
MEDSRSRRGCLWPKWPHESRPTHEYCGEQRQPGSSYCVEHRTMSIRDFDLEPRQAFVPHKAAA